MKNLWFSLILSFVALFAIISAHMEMKQPLPRKSSFNPKLKQSEMDHSLVNPLLRDGSNFPCKNYPAEETTATYRAGDTIEVKMSGSVRHGGGHCQFSLSYNEKDFVVLHTVMHDCFVGPSSSGLVFKIQLPPTTPACEKCVFSWTWVNAMGGREFYMNCADIKIINPESNAESVLVGKRMTVANLPGYPRIVEWPPAQLDGREIYESAPVISIAPKPRSQYSGNSTASDTLASSPTTATTADSTTTTVVTPLSPRVGNECAVGEVKCSTDREWLQCGNGAWFEMKVPDNTQCVQDGRFSLHFKPVQ